MFLECRLSAERGRAERSGFMMRAGQASLSASDKAEEPQRGAEQDSPCF